MKYKKVVLATLIVFVIGIFIGVSINLKNDKIHKVVSGYSFEISNKDVINNKLDGKYLDSFVTVVDEKDKHTVNLEGIDKESNVFIIDPTDGNMTSLKYNNEKFSVETKLDKDINYGIIVDYSLVGSIRVVEDTKNIDEEKLFTEILIGLGCGL